jgi:hypothetical protein
MKVPRWIWLGALVASLAFVGCSSSNANDAGTDGSVAMDATPGMDAPPGQDVPPGADVPPGMDVPTVDAGTDAGDFADFVKDLINNHTADNNAPADIAPLNTLPDQKTQAEYQRLFP